MSIRAVAKLALPFQITKKSRTDVEEPAYFCDPTWCFEQEVTEATETMQCRWAAACEFFLSLFPPFPPVQNEHPCCRKACVAVSDYEEESDGC